MDSKTVDLDSDGVLLNEGENELIVAYNLVDTEIDEQINVFFSRERAERKKKNLIEAWPEHTEESMEIKKFIENVR